MGGSVDVGVGVVEGVEGVVECERVGVGVDVGIGVGVGMDVSMWMVWV